ncbi:MAG: LTA synthase family protein [Firmicutes bacterium]|nr:LTA synthase family protein [Bacillota bacterium]
MNNFKKCVHGLHDRMALFFRKGSFPLAFQLPFLLVWLELTLHVFDGSGLRFAVIYLLFGLSFGGLLAAPARLLNEKAAKRYTLIWGWLLSVIYGAEFIAKQILQTYYPASILGTAADNKLYQFLNIILLTIAEHLHHLLLMLLPVALFTMFAKELLQEAEESRPWRSAKAFALLLAASFALHGLGLASLQLPWQGDLVPSMLYKMDINYNEQVEQLGLYSMLRLDIKHMFVAADYTEEFDPSLLAQQPEEPAVENPKLEGDDREELPQEPEEPEPDPVDRSPNVMDIDLAALRESTKSKDVQWLCDYFSSVEPTNKNEYTGMFKDYNVIFFTMEAFDSAAVSEEYTPTLYKLLHEGFVFNNFYSALHFTSTSNGECQNLLGLYPKNGKPITMIRTGQLKTNTYFTLARQLTKQGYIALGYHNNWDLYERSSSHPNAGYDWNFCSRGLNYEKSASGDLKWPQRDSFMIEDSIDDYIDSDVPFHVYYLTVTSHTPYSWNWVASQYKEQLADCEYSETTKAYIATLMEVDKALSILLQKLEEAGKLDKTLIVAAPDHIPYTAVESIEELTGKKLGTSAAASAIDEASLDLDVYRNGLILWSSSMTEPVQVDKVCCQVDILPTLSNLLGLEYDSRLLPGTDMLSESEGMVVFSSRCWKTDKGLYNRFTQQFTPAEGVDMTPEETESYVERTKALAGYRLDCTAKLVESNFYNLLFPQSN